MTTVIEEERVTATEVKQFNKDYKKYLEKGLRILALEALILWLVTRLPPDWKYFCKRLEYVANRQTYGYKSKRS